MKRLSMLVGACVFALAMVPSMSPATATSDPQPGALAQANGVYRFMIGDTRVIALSDGTVPQDYHTLLHGITGAATDARLSENFLVNPVQTSINVYLIELGSRRVLVDTGVGELFGAGNGGTLLGSLAAAGYRPDQIDDILITHVHADHIGGLVRGGKVIFPNAIIHVGKPDMAFFFDPPKGGAHASKKLSDEAIEMLEPYVAVGKVKPFEETSQILPGITATVRPGHTPGSAFYTLDSQGKKIVFVGDIVHSAAVQFSQPDVSIVYDNSGSLAIGVRKKAFSDFSKDGTLIAAPHLAFPGVGHIAASGSAYRWVPVEYTNWSKP